MRTKSTRLKNTTGDALWGAVVFFIYADLDIPVVFLILAIWEVFAQNGILCFLTHSRDLGAKLGGNDSYGRPASFLSSYKSSKTHSLRTFLRVHFLKICSTDKGHRS